MDEGFYGVHIIQAPQVRWYPIVYRVRRIRVQQNTCECQPVVYEFCSAGGLYFVRKHDRRGPTPIMAETAWIIREQAESVWLAFVADSRRRRC
ncbi:hypothetical protein GCM10009560_63180 [Nonomuraea longicatena]|uniref:Transposase n=1 Tax=Nonomuraea longicatena TaxID=83682 RepID=A0ABN1QT97_9ACTN